MEAETQISDENITREGDTLDRDAQYVSPEVAAARAGETVDFSMHVNANENDTDTDA